MSLSVLTRGGGYGGLFASIFVTGLSENSVVTATKDGVTKNGVWNATENRFEITKIKDLGTWTITATDGKNTATQDVLVDMITDYEIEMSYFKGLWLYNKGDECVDITGGWEATISVRNKGTLTKNDTYFRLKANTGNMAVVTQKVIPITQYKTINFRFVSAYATTYPTIVTWFIFSKSTTQNSMHTEIQVPTPSSYPKTYSYDISEYVTSDCYLCFSVCDNGYIDCDRVWLE